MDGTETHSLYQNSDSEQLEVNAKLFTVIRKRTISTQAKLDKIKKLLRKNPQPAINAKDGNDKWNTALHLAIKKNELEVVNFLLSKGADTSIENGDGKTPLHLAEECNHAEIIDALKSFSSQIEWPAFETDKLMSHTSQPVAANPNQVSEFRSNAHAAATGEHTASTVLPPFSGKLKVDKRLKLSNNYFKQSIQQFYANKYLSPIDQLKATPPYPTPYMLAQFASMAYADYQHAEPQPPDGWQLLTTASNSGIKNGYFGTAYWHPEHQQVVIAHRGTDIKSVGALVTDVTGVLFNNYVQQMSSASTFANKVVAVLQEIEREKKVSFELFFTGHSLGGWLAQITAFTTEYLEVRDSHEIQEDWLPRISAFITKTSKSKTGTFLKKLKREDHDTPASSAGQNTYDVREGWQTQVTAFNTVQMEEKGDTYHKKRKREEHDPPASSAGQDTHDVREGWQTQVTAFNTVEMEEKGDTYHKKRRREEKDPPASSAGQDTHYVREGWQTQVTAFNTVHIEEKGGTYHRKRKREEHLPTTSNAVEESHDGNECYHSHTVLFDSPGCKDMLLQMADKLDVRLHGSSIDLQHLDITSYLSAPNHINTCNSHLGTVYRIFTGFSEMGWKEKHTPLYNKAIHSMDKIMQAFDPETGQVHKDDKGELKIREVVDWPVSAALTGGAELNDFFKWAEPLNYYHSGVKDISHSKVRKGYHLLHYETKAYNDCKKNLNSFTQDEREFLERYHGLSHVPEFFKPEGLFSVLNNAEAKKETERKLQNFELDNERICCQDASTLHGLIPYVKRLVRLFPQIKEKLKDQLSSPQIRNKVYQYETQLNVEKIYNSALDFHPGALGLREFLDSDQQIWQLRKTDGDAWTGITKVYRVLEKTPCTPNYTSEGHYTILKLKQLLTVNRLMNLNALLDSMEKPHLLMIACGTNQPVNNELRDVFQELFSILKQKKTVKIILTTQSEGDIAAFVEDTAAETFGEGFIKTDEQLTWSDLTASSKTAILEKTVIFQGSRIVLNQLISAESMTDSFPLEDLLHEKELSICEEPVLSPGSGYNEKYYIDRTFKQNIVIKQDILNNEIPGKFADLLASTEQEFQQVCEQNPKSNVHWLKKDKTGELIWQQSKGNLSVIRKYIDAHKSQSYAPSNLDKLMQQAKHQRLMLIADKAGMGKTTVMTHLSKRIKQKYPAHWMVRIDLNDYTQLLNAQKGNNMDEHRVLEFVSKEVLMLNSHLEKELFKKCFEGNEISKVVVMVDGFDEISPGYKQTVIDMLQVLKQTSKGQLWVTTRTHLKDELEDNLQQLSYTLQPFSEVEQVEFLLKFWHQTLNFEVTNKHRLKNFATALIRKFARSISDKDREFTGIPLQTRMLAEAFKEEFNAFYLSEKSEPVLAHQLDLLGLYRRFIESKYDIYYTEKYKTPAGKITAEELRECDLKYIQVEHQRLALEELFNEDQQMVLQTDYDSTLSPEELARIGIAQRNQEGKPQFIHRTFADYYMAEFIIKQMTKKTKQHKQVQEILLDAVLLKEDCRVIRAFLDGLLENSNPSNEVLKEYGEKFIYAHRKGCITALHAAAKENNVRIIGFLLDSLKSGESLCAARKPLLARNHQGQTAWHKAAQNGHFEVLDKLWDWAKKVQLKPKEIRNLLLSKDRLKETAWQKAAKKGHVEVLEKLWECAKELQLKPEELKHEMLLSKDDSKETAWHKAAERSKVEILEKLWHWAKKLQLKPEELRNDLLFSKDKYRQMAWHKAAQSGQVEILKKLWDWAKELQLKPEELKHEMLLSKDDSKETAWHKAAERSKVEILEKLWHWAKKLQLKPEELRNDLLFSKDKYRQMAWHKAAQSGQVEILKKLWDWAKELQLKPEELRNDLLFSKDMYGQMAWHKAAEIGQVEILKKVWDWAKELQLKPEELRNELLFSKGMSGITAWHGAAERRQFDLLHKLWDWAKELQLKSQDVRSELLLSKDMYGKMAGHNAEESYEFDILDLKELCKLSAVLQQRRRIQEFLIMSPFCTRLPIDLHPLVDKETTNCKVLKPPSKL